VSALRAPAVLLVLVTMAGGCAPNLTPQQEWVMTNFESCRNETGGWNARLDRVEADGRFYVTVAQTQTDYNRVIECMRARQEKEAAGGKSTRP
jgi:hypothetical protein